MPIENAGSLRQATDTRLIFCCKKQQKQRERGFAALGKNPLVRVARESGAAALDCGAMRSRPDLFPPIEPYRTGTLRLDARHTMYWEQSGNPRGVPALFLHGGPGAGATPVHRRFFDPEYWRIVIFDQRGAGRSTPLGEIADNTPAHLVADIEHLRSALGIDKWLVFGGSWGSTLALHYAETHPHRCTGLVLRGIFLCRREEIEWFLYGIRRVFPEAWRAFSGFLPEAERSDILAAYYRRLRDPDPRVHMPAARAWSIYEGACSTLLPNPETVAVFGEDRLALGLARVEAHFFSRAFVYRRIRFDLSSRTHPAFAGRHRAGPLRYGLSGRRPFGAPGSADAIAGAARQRPLGTVAHGRLPDLRLPGHRKPLTRADSVATRP
jgi:proline iminopeptidase